MFTIDRFSSITHGFLTRQGGVSSGYFDSLNLALTKGDAVENIRQNRILALERLGVPGASLAICHQVHSSRVIVVERAWEFGLESAPKADALVTTHPNIVLGVLTADCVPILLADLQAGVIGVAHAGWKGLQQGIIQKVLQTMCQQGARCDHIVAAIGPCIHKSSYEVGGEVKEAFIREGKRAESYFQPHQKGDKYWCDLPGLTRYFLNKAGVTTVEQVNQDTYTQEDLFFSCRRSTHRQEPTFGCQVSALGL